MKLLLTSAGFTNNTIVKALSDLLDKQISETSIAYIPTASNIELGEKDWMINDILNIKKQNFKDIYITDISAVEEKYWRPTLEKSDVLFFEGGNTYHLMHWLNKSGLTRLLPNLLENKVYVGVSAGSMVTNKDLALMISQLVYEEDLDKSYEMPGLNFVDFYFLPHLNSPYFKNLREPFIRDVCKNIVTKIYAVDDQTAIKIDGQEIDVISEGTWFSLN